MFFLVNGTKHLIPQGIMAGFDFQTTKVGHRCAPWTLSWPWVDLFALRSAGLVWKAVSGSGERMLIGAASWETFLLHPVAGSFPYRFSNELTGIPPEVGATSLLRAWIFRPVWVGWNSAVMPRFDQMSCSWLQLMAWPENPWIHHGILNNGTIMAWWSHLGCVPEPPIVDSWRVIHGDSYVQIVGEQVTGISRWLYTQVHVCHTHRWWLHQQLKIWLKFVQNWLTFGMIHTTNSPSVPGMIHTTNSPSVPSRPSTCKAVPEESPEQAAAAVAEAGKLSTKMPRVRHPSSRRISHKLVSSWICFGILSAVFPCFPIKINQIPPVLHHAKLAVLGIQMRSKGRTKRSAETVRGTVGGLAFLVVPQATRTSCSLAI